MSHVYEAIYRTEGYILADVFRPNPGWGKTVKRVPVSAIPPHTDADVVEAAHRGAEAGYVLHSLEEVGAAGPPRRLFFSPVPLARPTRISHDI